MAKKRKHPISSDAAMNPALKEEIQTLRGGIVAQLEKKFSRRPSWLELIACEGRPAFLFRDVRSGREIEVGLCDMHGALDVLSAFFGDE